MATEHRTPPGFTRITLPGSKRVVYDPGNAARAIHTRFATQVREKWLDYNDPLLMVRSHVDKGHRFFFKTDLSDAFSQCSLRRLDSALTWRRISPGWLTPTRSFFHEGGRGGLIQGAPCSSYLFETYCRFGGLDRELFEYCDKLGFYYTRYVDDILISAPRWIGKRVGPSIREIVARHGFALNDKKTRRVDVQCESLEVLGLQIRGNRIDASFRIMQRLHETHDPKSVAALFKYNRRVRNLGKP